MLKKEKNCSQTVKKKSEKYFVNFVNWVNNLDIAQLTSLMYIM